METIQQLCVASTRQFVEMTALIEEYKNKNFTETNEAPIDLSTSKQMELYYKELCQIIDWVCFANI